MTMVKTVISSVYACKNAWRDHTHPFLTKTYYFFGYRVHGTQEDRLEFMVSMQKSPNQTCILLDVLANILGLDA